MAPVLSEWLPEGDLAHFVSDLVESGALDLSAIYASYEQERGFPPYDPRLMVKLLVYGYANGVMSSRKLEAASYRDVAVRMLCADQHPDYRSIARFRARHLGALAGLFVQALRLCRQARLVGLGALALDGTKLRANASRHKAMSYERMVKKEARLEAEIAALRRNVDALLEAAERVDAAEDERFGPDRRGDELPQELQRREQRLAVIREAKQALEAEAFARESARRAELEAQGKKPRPPREGRDPFKPKPTAQRNFTDPESKIMKTSDGAYHQCFNGQAIVDSEAQVIVVAELSDQAPDAEQLAPALDQLDENLDAIDAELPEGAVLTADGGYFSEGNVKTTVAHGLDPFIATGRFKHSSRSRQRGAGRSPRTPHPSGGWRARRERRRAVPSTPGARRSSSRCSASWTPSKTQDGCSYAASRPPAPSGASTARSTTCSSSTGPAASPSSGRNQAQAGHRQAETAPGRHPAAPSATGQRRFAAGSHANGDRAWRSAARHSLPTHAPSSTASPIFCTPRARHGCSIDACGRPLTLLGL
jgi:transposase